MKVKIIVAESEFDFAPRKYSKLKTAVLIFDERFRGDALNLRFVEDCINIGAEWFVIWGASAELIEDRLDYFLIDLDLGGTPTVSFSKESLRDTIEFALNGIFFDVEVFRLVVMSDPVRFGVVEILKVIRGVAKELGIQIDLMKIPKI